LLPKIVEFVNVATEKIHLALRLHGIDVIRGLFFGINN